MSRCGGIRENSHVFDASDRKSHDFHYEVIQRLN